MHSTAAVAEGTTFAVDESGALYALDALTGELFWEMPFDVRYETKWHVPSPVASDGAVYVSGPDDRFYAVDATDGSIRWTAEGHFDPPAIAGSTLYVAGSDLLALDAVSGETMWRFEPEDRVWGINGASVASGTVLCCCSCQEVLALAVTSGAVRWRHSLSDTSKFEGPAIAGDMIFVNGGDGVYALRAS